MKIKKQRIIRGLFFLWSNHFGWKKSKFGHLAENVTFTPPLFPYILNKMCLKNGTIHPGMNVMACGFGVGLSWGGTILKF